MVNDESTPKPPKFFLAVISNAEALAWVLANRRMAFPAERHRAVEEIQQDDRLFIYTSRACFHNPTRDRSRVIACATVESAPIKIEPEIVAQRTFSYTSNLSIEQIAPLREGVELAKLIDELESFPNKRHWSIRLRRPPIRLTANDALIISEQLQQITGPIRGNLPAYIDIGKRLATISPQDHHAQRQAQLGDIRLPREA